MKLQLTTLALLLLIISFSCDNKTIQPSADPEKWTQQIIPESLTGIMNSASQNDQLNILSPSHLFKNIDVPQTSTQVNRFSIEGTGDLEKLKMPMGHNYYTFYNRDKVTIKSALTDEQKSIVKTIDLKTMDQNFDEFIEIPYWQGECMGISKNDLLLIPYRAVKNGNAVSTPYFLLASIESPQNSDHELSIRSSKLIQEDLFPGIVGVYQIQSFFDSFFVVMGAYTYRIDADGNIYRIAESKFNIFQQGIDLYAISSATSRNTTHLFKSANKGETWMLLGELIPSLSFDFQLKEIDDKLIAYTKSQLFLLDISDTNYTITELDNEGLGLADITSISLTKENYVFVTTKCNSFASSCGAYYKPLEDFCTPKKNP